jgi:hypothetical protein
LLLGVQAERGAYRRDRDEHPVVPLDGETVLAIIAMCFEASRVSQ